MCSNRAQPNPSRRRLEIEGASKAPILEPVLSYQILLPEGLDPRAMLPKLRLIEEEEPELRIVWDEELKEIQAQIMEKYRLKFYRTSSRNDLGLMLPLIRARWSTKRPYRTGL